MGRHAAVFLPTMYPHHRRRLAAGPLPAAPRAHCAAAARQLVQLYGASPAHCHRGGLVEGDRWHLICVQEGVLFSYLEEPRTNVNIKHRPGAHSPELDAWIAADPESHFCTLYAGAEGPPGQRPQLCILPRIAGTED